MTAKKTLTVLVALLFCLALTVLLVLFAGAACSEKVTLRFETAGGTYIASVEGAEGEGYARPADPEKEGYYFDGWYLDARCEGERQTLPAVMPGASVTYYAKYLRCPAIVIKTGTEEKTVYLRPGENLLSGLAPYEPAREGLIFGGWFRDGVPVGADALVGEEDDVLTARFKAAYEAEVYLQAADDPGRYVLDGAHSFSGQDWEGETVSVEAPEIEHFRLDEERTVPSVSLGAGENAIKLYYEREKTKIAYEIGTDSGTETFFRGARYGAETALAEAPETPDGYVFFGWSLFPDGGGSYPAGSKYRAEGDVTFYGCYAERYAGARGDGDLYAALTPRGDGSRRAVFFSAEGAAAEGTLSAEGVFSAEGAGGRLDGRGCYLSDDSGEYEGVSLGGGRTGEGLILDFANGRAVYRRGGEEDEGAYRYVCCGGSYTGRYEFEGRETFAFALSGKTFLREGEEKGTYRRYDLIADAFCGEELSLDGFGGARFGGEEGSYLPSDGEWLYSGGETFRFRLGGLVWRGGEAQSCEKGYLVYDPALSGVYLNEGGALLLDGYGAEGRYTSGGETAAGPFRMEGPIVTLSAGPGYRFTLKGNTFLPTGGEAGSYEGERGTLFLDGAGGARLSGRAGTYAAYDRAEWQYGGENGFRFRLGDGKYEVFSDDLFGTFEADMGVSLTFDGYGGGTYAQPLFLGDPLPFALVYADETVAEIGVERGGVRGRLVFSVDRAARTAVRRDHASAGVFALADGGLLVLDGEGGAKRIAEGRTVRGSCAAGERGEVTFGTGKETLIFRLFEEDGVWRGREKGASGVYEGEEGTLTLDGYGKAVWTGAEPFESAYVLRGGAAEVEEGGVLRRFLLGDGRCTLAVYTRYDGEGTLYLEEGGTRAFLRGEKDVFGSWEGGAVSLFSGGGERFSFKIYGGAWYRYDAAKEGTFTTADGQTTLVLDGCGNARCYTGGGTLFGTVTEADGGRLYFLSEDGALLGFALSDGGLLPLGAETGEYVLRGGEGVLQLFGDGRGRLFDGQWRSAVYRDAGGGEFDLLSEGEAFRVRIGREDGRAYFERKIGALAALAGEYGALAVDGYRILFGGEEYRFLHAGEGVLFAEDGAGSLFCFVLGESCRREEARREFTLL